MGKFGSPHKLCIIRTLEFVYFPFLGLSARAQWVNLEVPINCVLLERWNLYIFPFWGHAHAGLQWVNLEVPINCVLLKHWNKYVFPFWVTLLGPNG